MAVSNSADSTVILWHRRDLRLHDNAALQDAVARKACVVPIFIIDPLILSREDTAPARVSYLLEALRVLQERYAQVGGSLIIRQGNPVTVLPQLAQETQASLVVWNQDIEPYASQRDQAVEAALVEVGISVLTYQDMLLHRPGEILTQNGDIYSVYTPFWRNWSTMTKPAPFETPTQVQAPDSSIDSLPIPTLEDLNFSCDQALPAAGEQVALDLLDHFCAGQAIFEYSEQRNFPAQPGTSQLSPHLRWGTLGIRQVWQATLEAEAQVRSDEAADSLTTWRQEIAWREFYKHVLAAWPRLETQAYRSKYDDLEWDNNPDHFEAWCAGLTGYPIVDAAMRQLNQTGWMHNRCRMIVASFLTKDLLIDWRWGERYFMQKLVDGDLAANNGGWQWSAGVGTDPKPLRIFNPSTQAAKFDPEGEYIRTYVPELSGVDTPALLDVSTSKSGKWALAERKSCGYPAPIVDHKQQQNEFKQRYQACQ